MLNYFHSLFNSKAKVYATLALIPLCLYIKSLFFDFSPMDDQWMIVKNADVLSKWKNLSVFFTNPLSGLYYRPLFSLSLMLDFYIGGVSPYIYHFSNLIYHLISVILVYKLFIGLNINEKTSFIFTLIFGIHPVLLHAVAWIPGRNDLLLTVFFLSSTLLLISYLKENKLIYFIGHVFFFSCSLLTKENAFTFILIYAFLIFQNQKQFKSYIFLVLFWCITILSWYLLRYQVVQSNLSVGQNGIESIKNFLIGLLLYFGKILFPIKQSVFPTIKNSSIIPGLIAIVILVGLYLKFGLKNKLLAILGVIIFFATLVIPVWYGATSSTGEQYEHRIYLPLIGLLLFVSQINFNQNSNMFLYGGIFTTCVYAVVCFYRMNVYKNEMSFLEAGIKEAPDYYLFIALKGDKLLEQNKFRESIPYYNKAITMQPWRPQLYNSRACALIEIGKTKEAISDFGKAIEYSNHNPDMYLNRCYAYKNTNDIENAMKDLGYLKKKSPQTVPPDLEKELLMLWYNILAEKVTKDIAAQPKNANLYVTRAKILHLNKKSDLAIKDLERACELEPNNDNFKNHLKTLQAQIK